MSKSNISLGDKFIIMSFIFTILLLALISYNVFSKYVLSIKDSTILSTSNLVFTSDFLSDNDIVPTYDVYENKITFKLKNNDDKNVDITDKNIKYNIESTCGTLSKNNGTLTGNVDSSDSITLESDNLESCKVTATSTYPYKKIISATFNFKGIDTVNEYIVTDKGYYIVLNILTGNNLKDISIDYTGFLPDTTNSLMNDWLDGTNKTISKNDLSTQSNYELRFKKTDATNNKNYSMDKLKTYKNSIKLNV